MADTGVEEHSYTWPQACSPSELAISADYTCPHRGYTVKNNEGMRMCHEITSDVPSKLRKADTIWYID